MAVQLRYLCNRLTDFDITGHGDASVNSAESCCFYFCKSNMAERICATKPSVKLARPFGRRDTVAALNDLRSAQFVPIGLQLSVEEREETAAPGRPALQSGGQRRIRRLRPRHSLHARLVQCWRSPSSRTRRNQYNAVTAIACA